MKSLERVLKGYWAYMTSPKGKYEWQYYLIFLALLLGLTVLIIGALSFGKP